MRMTQVGKDTLAARSTLSVGSKQYAYYSLAKAAETIGVISRLPFSMKVLLENMLRFEDGGFTVSTADAQAIADWQRNPRSEEHTSELQSLMRLSYAVFCLKKKTNII